MTILLEVDIPSWIEAGSAVITCIGLIVTLILQKKTFRDQQAMLKLSVDESRKAILPIFQATYVTETNEYEEVEGTFIYVTLERNDAYSVEFIISERNPLNLRNSEGLPRTIKAGHTTYFYYNPSQVYKSTEELVGISIKFQDLDRRMYEQKVMVRNGSMFTTPPLLKELVS